jgi:hypothetical protein
MRKIIFLIFITICWDAKSAGAPVESLINPAVSIPSLNIDNKLEVSCEMLQTKTPFVILGLGQSLIANHNGSPAFWQNSPKHVFEFWDGKCYKANFPLYGASGDSKSFVLPLADLISQANGREVIIVMTAAGGADVARFSEGGDLLKVFKRQIKSLKSKSFNVSVVIFEQGQSDRDKDASYYLKNVNSMIHELRSVGVKAPIFLSLDSRLEWSKQDKLDYTVIIRKIKSNSLQIFSGPRVDLIMNRFDGTHMDENGLLYQAGMWFQCLNTFFDW